MWLWASLNPQVAPTNLLCRVSIPQTTAVIQICFLTTETTLWNRANVDLDDADKYKFCKQLFPSFLFLFRMSLSFQMLWSPAICAAFLGCSNLHTVSLWVSRNVSSPWPLRLGFFATSKPCALSGVFQPAQTLSSPPFPPPSTWHRLHGQEKQRQPFSLLSHPLKANKKKKMQGPINRH